MTTERKGTVIVEFQFSCPQNLAKVNRPLSPETSDFVREILAYHIAPPAPPTFTVLSVHQNYWFLCLTLNKEY